MYSAMDCQLLRRGGQAKQFEMPVTMLPHVKNEQLQSVTLDFKPCLKKAFERSDLIAARVVILKAVHEIKQSISDILTITINTTLLYIFSSKYHPPPPTGTPPILVTAGV
jgi:hypothetical protein